MRKKRRKGHRKPLDDRMRQAAQLMFEGEKMGQISALLGVHRTTLWRWYHRPDFQREVTRITEQWLRRKRRETIREWHSSPEYRKAQNRAYYYRRKLPALAKKLQEAGESHNTRAYAAASKAYDECFNKAYFGGKTASEILSNFSLW